MYSKDYIYEMKEFYRSAFKDNYSSIYNSENAAVQAIKDRTVVLDLDFKKFTRKVCKHGLVEYRIYYFNPDISGVCFLIEKKEVK